MRVVKPTKSRHHGKYVTTLSFHDALKLDRQSFFTQPGNVPFVVCIGKVTRGRRRGEDVIIFKTNGKERARAYSCCWSHITNCNRTYIDCYLKAI